MSRREWLTGSIFALAAIVAPATRSWAGALAHWPAATDLATDARTAAAQRQPIVLYFTRRDCPFCVRAERYLEPLAERRGSDAIFRRIEADRRDLAVIDFAGNRLDHAALARALNGTLTPTVAAYSPTGQLIGEPIIGLPVEEFYEAYVSGLIDDAKRRLASP